MTVNPNVTRATSILEIAAGLVASGDRTYQPVTVSLGEKSDFRLASGSSASSIRDVIAKRADLALVNPSSALMQAYRGCGPFKTPQPVRLIAVLPSEDQFVFAARPDIGMTHLEDFAVARLPLRVSLRGSPDHCMHDILNAITAEAGFAWADIEARGGAILYDGGVPRPGSPRFLSCVEGEIDALFDEGSGEWLAAATEAGMTILSLRSETVQRLEAIGFRKAWLRKADFPELATDVLTIEFSGWPFFVHADLPDSKVRGICQALDSRRHLIPWQGEGGIPIETMVRDTPATPHFIPMHPAAEAFWHERGYI
jgi:TRAP-type uncharacterized transport system substrate-binding protein